MCVHNFSFVASGRLDSSKATVRVPVVPLPRLLPLKVDCVLCDTALSLSLRDQILAAASVCWDGVLNTAKHGHVYLGVGWDAALFLPTQQPPPPAGDLLGITPQLQEASGNGQVDISKYRFQQRWYAVVLVRVSTSNHLHLDYCCMHTSPSTSPKVVGCTTCTASCEAV